MTTITAATSISNFANQIKANGFGDMKKATGEFIVNVKDVHFTPEWNLRHIDDEHVNEIAIAINNGEKVDPLELEAIFVDEKPAFQIVDGHHTYCAIQKLVDKNEHSGDHQATMFKGSEADKVIRAFNSTQGRPLTPYETAKAFERMLNEGLTRSDIAKRTGKKLSFISNALFLLNADEGMKTLIETGAISPSRAGRLMRENGELATAIARIEVGTPESQETTEIPEQPTTENTNSVPNDSRVTLESSDTNKMRKAAKSATKLRSLSAGKMDSIQELISSLAGRVDSGVIELNTVLEVQLQELSKDIQEIKEHNRNVIETMKSIQ